MALSGRLRLACCNLIAVYRRPNAGSIAAMRLYQRINAESDLSNDISIPPHLSTFAPYAQRGHYPMSGHELHDKIDYFYRASCSHDLCVLYNGPLGYGAVYPHRAFRCHVVPKIKDYPWVPDLKTTT